MLWRLAQNHRIPTCFCTDSNVTRAQAVGEMGAAKLTASYRCLRGAAQALTAMLAEDGFRVTHVRGHSGDPFNDFVDYAAKQERAKSFYLPRPTFNMTQLREFIPHLWSLFHCGAGLPPLCQDGFSVPPPTLPCSTGLETCCTSPSRWTFCQHSLSFATANVQSLYTGADGYGGKVAFLPSQFVQLGLNFLGIQEARSSVGCTCADRVLRLAGGADRGHYGIELWVNLNQPVAYQDSRPVFLKKGDVAVLVMEPRLLIGRIAHDLCSLLLVVAHAPHSGSSNLQRKEWWHHMISQILELHHGGQEHVVLMIDSNAATGPCELPFVGPLDDKQTANTPEFRECLKQLDLCLPATFGVHQGEHATWTSPSGDVACRIDFVAIPCSLASTCQFSTVLTDLDLGALRLDHQAAAIQLQWSSWLERPVVHRDQDRSGFARDHLSLGSLTLALDSMPVAPWECDIEKHVHDFNTGISKALHRCHPPGPSRSKGPFVSSEIWALRAQKLAVSKQLRALHRRHRLEGLFWIWRSWRGDFSPALQHSAACYTNTLKCIEVKLVTALHVRARDLRTQLRRSKQRFLAEKLQELPEDTPASQILREVQRVTGPTNPKKIKRSSLPFVKTAEGITCRTPQMIIDRWADFFGAMEGGTRLPHAVRRELWCQNLKRFQQENFDISLLDLPSLCDLERSFARVCAGKAIGPDRVPPELCKHNAPAMARLSYSQLLKLALHGQESLLHKGGKLVHAYKGKGAMDNCASYRSLLISSHQGKVLHRTLRQHQSSLYEAFSQNQQLGGRRQVPVTLGVHHLRAYQRIQKAQHRPCAVLFLDLREAFYRVLRPLALDCPWTDEDIAGLAARLHLPPGIVAELHEHLHGPNAVALAGVPNHVRNYT